MEEKLQQHYLEQVFKWYPLHRALLFVVVLMGVNEIAEQNPPGPLQYLDAALVMNLASPTTGFLASLSLLEVILAILLVAAISAAFGGLAHVLLRVVSGAKLSSGFTVEEFVQDEWAKSATLTDDNTASHWISLAAAREQLGARERELKNKIQLAEVSFGFAILVAIWSWFGREQVADWALSCLLFALYASMQWRIVKYYLARVIPVLVRVRALEGVAVAFSDDAPKN